MKEVVLITGANGGLAKVVKKMLSESYEIRSLTTQKKCVDRRSIFYCNIKENHVDEDALIGCKHIVHLSGYSILKPWTKKNKELMYVSRVNGATLLFNKCKALNIHPSTFISASASGIYGLKADGCKNEKSEIGTDWVANMAYDWESASNKFRELGTRVIQMRISLLFSKTTGFLKYNLLSMKFGIGAILGDKESPVNWIHVNDVSRFILDSIKNKDYQGAYNLTNGNIISQNELIKTIKREKYPYALIVHIPISAIKIFIGEKSLILNNKITLSIKKLRQIGFSCKYNTIQDVLKEE